MQVSNYIIELIRKVLDQILFIRDISENDIEAAIPLNTDNIKKLEFYYKDQMILQCTISMVEGEVRTHFTSAVIMPNILNEIVEEALEDED